MRKPTLILFAVLCAAVAAQGTKAWAADGRIPLLSLSGPPYSIDQPGDYVLTRDIVYTAGTVVVIKSDGVTLDLAGHSITGPATAAVTLFISASGTRPIIVQNGRVVGGSQGIGNTTRSVFRLERLDVSGSLNGIVLVANHAEILDCHVHDLATGTGGNGISVDALDGRILDNLVENVPGSGMVISGLRGGQVHRNIVRAFGASVSAGSGLFLQGTFADPLNGGLAVTDNTVSGLPDGSDDTGIRIITANALISGNVATQNGFHGIDVMGAGNRIEGNVASHNGSNGIRVISATGTVLIANVSQGNGACGIDFGASTGIIYRDNILAANTLSTCDGTATNAGGNYCDAALCP